MRAIPNLLQEVEVLRPDHDPVWGHVWGAEVLGRAIGHELRYWLMTDPPDADAAPHNAPSYASLTDPALPKALIAHHIADVL